MPIKVNIQPIDGYIKINWENSNILSHDYVAVYDSNSNLIIGNEAPKTYIQWYWAHGKSNILTDIKYFSDKKYFAVYASYENNKYCIKQISSLVNVEHEMSLHGENQNHLTLTWSNSHQAALYDYVALFDYRPEVGARNLQNFLSWEWVVSTKNGSYRSSVQHRPEQAYYMAYCSWENNAYRIKKVVGIIEEYRLENVVYTNFPSELPPLQAAGLKHFELCNHGDSEVSLTSKIASACTTSYSWSTANACKVGTKQSIKVKIPFLNEDGLGWEITTEYSYSHSHSEGYSRQHTFDLAGTAIVPPRSRKQGIGFFQIGSVEEIPYTGDELVRYRGSDRWDKRQVHGFFKGDIYCKQKIDIYEEEPLATTNKR